MKTTYKRGSKDFLEELYVETSIGKTKNGAKTYTRSGSALLDFFAQAGAMRNSLPQAVELFAKAYSEDRFKAIKLLFYIRDIRGGQGERDIFLACLSYLIEYHKEVFEAIVKYAPEYGRWKDIFFDNPTCFNLIKEQLLLDKDSDTPSLLAKWLPSINASSQITRNKARYMSTMLGYNEIEYRKTIRNIRKKLKTIEETISSNKWDEINYSNVPSQAGMLYRSAFMRHSPERYAKFIEEAIRGEVSINSNTLYPYQIYNSVITNYSMSLEALWQNLPDYTRGKKAIVVADTSGSMTCNNGLPMACSVSLALYFAERNTGDFQNHFITFSTEPKLQRITGKTLFEKMHGISTAEWKGSTDLQKVFDLVLNTAVKNNVSQNDLPETIYIISDMEFNSCTDSRTNFEYIKDKYALAGYVMPQLVFWNVNASGRNLPVLSNEGKVCLVSGLSPVVFKLAVEGLTSLELMNQVIESERYSKIVI